ncbi:MAG: DUF2065 domain-containing protein [Deltaproteobacteria bacterium]|jgi:uncharacterized protein YjeT (DUF2065 family)|nr:DUF2065 domain-containing protein [Deltaproteobacteria bacterium]
MHFDLALFLCALGLAFMLEATLYVLFPEGMRRILVRMAATPAGSLRVGGLFGLGLGAIIIWIGRGLG